MRGVLALCLIVSLLGGMAGPAAGASANVSVTDVTVTPRNPLPGEDVTITATIRNLEGSDSSLTLDGVALQYTEDNTVKESTRASNLGTLSPGSEIRVPLSVSFASTGTKQFRIVVYGQDEDGTRVKVKYPVVVQVSESHPSATLETADPIAGIESNATLRLSNGLEDPVRSVFVTLEGENIAIGNNRRAISRLESGEEHELDFSIKPTEPGSHPLSATIEYSIGDGHERTVTQTERIDVEALRDRVELVARSTETNGTRALSVEVTNLGNADIENILLQGTVVDATVGTAVISELDPGKNRNVTLPVEELTNQSTVTVSATYDVGARTNRVETSVAVKPLPAETHPGRVTLTGVDLESADGPVRITGSASNVGLSPAHSVIVRVVPTDGVSPSPPNREYFVGTVPESDFVSFDVYATVEPDVTTIPLEVTYLSDGERKTTTVEVPADVEQTQPQAQTDSQNGILVPALGGVAVVAVIVGLIYLGWRNYRGGA